MLNSSSTYCRVHSFVRLLTKYLSDTNNLRYLGVLFPHGRPWRIIKKRVILGFNFIIFTKNPPNNKNPRRLTKLPKIIEIAKYTVITTQWVFQTRVVYKSSKTTYILRWQVLESSI